MENCTVEWARIQARPFCVVCWIDSVVDLWTTHRILISRPESVKAQKLLSQEWDLAQHRTYRNVRWIWWVSSAQAYVHSNQQIPASHPTPGIIVVILRRSQHDEFTVLIGVDCLETYLNDSDVHLVCCSNCRACVPGLNGIGVACAVGIRLRSKVGRCTRRAADILARLQAIAHARASVVAFELRQSDIALLRQRVTRIT